MRLFEHNRWSSLALGRLPLPISRRERGRGADGSPRLVGPRVSEEGNSDGGFWGEDDGLGSRRLSIYCFQKERGMCTAVSAEAPPPMELSLASLPPRQT